MPSFAEQLMEIANRVVLSHQGSVERIERELAEIEAQKATLQAQLRTAHLAQSSLRQYVPISGSNYNCPRCWVDREDLIAVHGTAHGKKATDTFRCPACDLEFELNF